MQLIYDIVKKLKNQEIRRIRQQINQSSFEYEKMGKLFNLVTRYGEKEEAFYAQKLYQKPPDNTFRVTKSRLKRMLENVLLNDKSLKAYPSVISARLQARKRLLQGEILLGRGAYLAARNILQQVSASARNHGLYEEEFQAEMLLYRNQSIRSSVREFSKQTDKLLQLNQMLSSVNEARILYYSTTNLLFNKSLKKEQREMVRSHIDQMKGLRERIDHPQIHSMYLLSEIYYHQIIQQDDLALSFCEQYLELVQKEEALSSPQTLATAYGHLAQVNLRLFHLEDARHYAMQTLELFSNDEMNYLQSLELLFISQFYLNDLEAAIATLEEAFSHPEFQTTRILAARWFYLKACLQFSQENYRDAYLTLNDTAPLLADKFGMNISIRLLEIMIMYEMGNHDLMETKILNMRQFIKRTQKSKEFLRANYLIQLLMFWYRNSYDFGKALESRANMPQIKEAHPATMPDARYELIRLEDWMRDHT